MRTIRLDIEYDGSRFSGFQRQPHQAVRTVQGDLEGLLSRVLSEPVKVVCAGRTDAGVHALGQVVSFKTESDISIDVMQRAVNGLFHGDLAVHAAREVEPSFHARHSASSRTYQYLIYQSPTPPSVMGGYVWHVFRPLDMNRMQEAVHLLQGQHDFRSFSSQGSHMENTIRTIKSLSLGTLTEADVPAVGRRLQGSDTLMLTVEADAFLPHMVRMMVGTIVRVGTGELGLDHVRTWLDTPRDGAAGPPAPPQGLCLVSVKFDRPTETRIMRRLD